MGALLVDYYSEAARLGGLQAKMELAQQSRVPSTRAMLEPDSPAHLSVFEAAMKDLRRKYAGGAAPTAESTAKSAVASATGSEEMLWGVLSSLHDSMVALFDAQGKCTLSWESKSLSTRYGAGAGKTLTEYLADKHGADIKKVFATQLPLLGEYEVGLADVVASVSLTLSPVHANDGKIRGVAAFVQDISERKNQQRKVVESERRMRDHNRVFLDLMATKATFLSSVDATLQRITEAAAKTLDVARASIWLYDAGRTKITCVDLYIRDTNQHSAGTELFAKDFPTYFKALEAERTIAAGNAHTDPRTSCFSTVYLTPLAINAMLDVPIWVNGEMLGVVCHEHIGPFRDWTTDEENFAYLMGNFVAMAKEREKVPT